MQAMYDLVGERIPEIFDAQTVDIGVVDARRADLVPVLDRTRSDADRAAHRHHGVPQDRARDARARGRQRGHGAEVPGGGQPVAIAGEPPKSSVFVPLSVGDRGTGVMSLHNLDREHAFSEADVRLLTTIAGSLAWRSRTRGCSRRRASGAANWRSSTASGRPSPSSSTSIALIERLGDQLQSLFGADIVYVALHNEATDMIEFAYYFEDGQRGRSTHHAVRQGLTSKILQTREPLLAEPDARRSRGRRRDRWNAGALVPRRADRRGGPRDRRDQRPEHPAGRPVRRERHRGCCPRSLRTSASPSRTPGSTARPSGGRARWPHWPTSDAKSVGCSIRAVLERIG